MKIPLNSNDRLLIVQFDLGNFEALPFRLPDKGTETKQEANQRRVQNKKNDRSARLADKNGKVFAVYMPISLYENDYALVNAEYRERIDKNRRDTFYHVVRYTFVRKAFEKKNDQSFQEFLPWRGIHSAGMQELCELAIWGQVRIYRNPFYENGIEIPGHSAISINLDARVPLYESNTSAETFTPDDANKPDHLLVIVKNSLMLDPFS